MMASKKNSLMRFECLDAECNVLGLCEQAAQQTGNGISVYLHKAFCIRQSLWLQKH
jgi:hypothetical protein